MFRVKNESAAPFRPDRPHRPTRCVYCSTDPGMSQFTTCSRPVMSRPLPATSVATRHGVFPDLKSRSAASRFSCFSSPCSIPTFSPWRRSASPTKFTVLIRLQNTNTRDRDRPSFLRKSVKCFSNFLVFLCSAQTCTVCSTPATSAPSPLPPAATATLAAFDFLPSALDLSVVSILAIAGFGASHIFATALTVLGNVALNSNVWRPLRIPIPPGAAKFPSSTSFPSTSSSLSFRGNAFLNVSSCSANPSASMRSASSMINIRARVKDNALVSKTAVNRPGVPTTRSAKPLACVSSSSCVSCGAPP